jgi:polyhydroxybutyrate depolymerase
MLPRRHALLLASALAFGCGGKSPPPASKPPSPLIAARPYEILVPDSYNKAKPAPLIVLLHGYSANGVTQLAYFGFTALSQERGVLVAYPNGLIDSQMKRFWNADDACCNFDNNPVDDVAYLNALVDDVEQNYNVDPKRVYFVGHSNGAFMSHRMACDHAGRVAAIAALAGDVWKDASKCNPSEPVAVLQIHGDADETIPYPGDGKLIPSALDSVATWAAKNGCTGMLTPTDKTYDLETHLPGAETVGAAYSCPHGAAELWTIHGGMHVPSLRLPDWGNDLFDWLEAHAKR